jgi:uncharacterized protein (DUF697 family)
MEIIETVLEKIKSEITDVEDRDDLSDEQKRAQIIHLFSVICAVVAIQPIPFADIFVLTPIQAYMGTRLSAIRHMPLSEAESTDLIKEIAGVMGLGMLAQQAALGLYKVGLPGLAGFTTIPLVYGLTYAIGHVMDYYLENKSRNGGKLTSDQLKCVWEKAREEAKGKAKAAKDEIMARKNNL